MVNAEPMWQLGLESYPERPDEADCIYYLRTGFCGYGSRCRFNHPRDRSSVNILKTFHHIHNVCSSCDHLCNLYLIKKRNRSLKLMDLCTNWVSQEFCEVIVCFYLEKHRHALG